jgi:hypothetical protein
MRRVIAQLRSLDCLAGKVVVSAVAFGKTAAATGIGRCPCSRQFLTQAMPMARTGSGWFFPVFQDHGGSAA